MSADGRRILERMLDRLFAAIVSGPSIDCRPRNSRQRLDLTELSALRDADPAAVIAGLLGAAARARVVARVPAPPRPAPGDLPGAPESGTEEDAPVHKDRRAFERQQSVVRKLRLMAEEARTYEEDTGVYVLHVGFPLLYIARGTAVGTRRVLAPLAFIPVTMRVSTGPAPSVDLACHYSGEDRVAPNEALLAWLERQTGRSAENLLADDDGSDPWRELGAIARAVAGLLEIEPPDWLAARTPDAPAPALEEAPSSDDRDPRPRIVSGAVLGLYPVSNQGLVRDTAAMIEQGAGDGPVRPFLTLSPDLPPPADDEPPSAPAPASRPRFEEERFVAPADPCQARAVRLAREQRGLVIHGPPGTGKSQTITNIIADHLARGERVLFVCDKRTALDVVANRLHHLGLGDLCALIHDPQRDQRDLYMSIRDQLERLADTHASARDERRIAAIDGELSTLHAELRAAWRALMTDPEQPGDPDAPATAEAGGAGSFHDLVGRWLAIEPPPEHLLDGAALGDLRSRDLAAHEMDARDALDRAARVDYPVNPWVEAAGVTLGAFLAEPGDRVRHRLDVCVRTGEAADESRVAGMPPFDPAADVQQQAAALARLADDLDHALAAPANVRARWAGAGAPDLERARAVIESVRAAGETVRHARPDPQVDAVLRASGATPATLAPQIGALHRYLAVSGKWWSFLAFGARRRAAAVCAGFGLPLDDPAAARLLGALEAERDRQLLAAAIGSLEPGAAPEPGAGALTERLAAHDAVVGVLIQAAASPQATALVNPVRAVLGAPGGEGGAALAAALRAAPARAAALARHAEALRACALFRADWIGAQHAHACANEPLAPLLRTLQDRLESLETILRIGAVLERLPAPLARACARLLSSGAAPQDGWSALTKAALAAEVSDRVASSAALKQLDGARIEASLERIASLHEHKRSLVRDLVLARWVSTQRDRLLAGTGSRLNSQGADVKRRLLTRGRRALRLRQVLAHGRSIEGGDPLFDLRPVWMASPETVAQVFPREPVFDAVIFDEASQCRLEEALPVLTRARRVVIAGDPRQLPPSRFFESTVETSEEPGIETDQDLFEAQQSEVEDLLGAALGLDLEQSYLDVHYRSRNADLIGFSNEHFYGSRLQPIPGHPKNRSRLAPLTMHRVDGVYDQSVNRREAQEVVRLVRDLLRRAEPPSIGVACFNVLQRDAILEALDEAADADEAFARRLGAARERRGAASFEGLFVKNLENVQGDERDHIIISTTYGPNPQGRFYRRFGPLLRAGGGRRLNVLVTRARHEVHLVTSIPADAYRSLPPVPDGQAAGGAWLLFAYLRYAEGLADLYEEAHAARESAHGAREPGVIEHVSGAPSALAPALARRLARRGIGSEVHWGNDGFCVDAALSHPTRVDDVTIGVLSDLTRFPGASDPVEWEVFRWLILRSQGWDLHRVWSPGVFRDIAGVERQIEERARACLAAEEDPDALRVRGPGDA